MQTIRVFGYIIGLLGILGSELPRISQSRPSPQFFMVWRVLKITMVTRTRKVPKLPSFRRIHAIQDVAESIKERLEYRTIFDRWNIYILFVFFSNGGYVVANVGIGYRNFEKIELNFSDPKEEYFSRRLSSSNLRLNKLDIAPTRLFSEIHRIMLRVSL